MTGRRCPGLHCPGCGNGSGIIALVVMLAIAGAVIHAIWHTLVEVAEIAALTVLGTAGLAAVAGIAWLAHRARQDRPGRPIPARPVYQLPPEPPPSLEGSHNPAVGPARQIHLHLHGLTPEQIAAIVTNRYTGGNE